MGYYDKTTNPPLTIYYGGTGNEASEPNMRQELINTLDGSVPEIAKGHWVVLRQLTRTNGALIPCDCVDSLGEADKDIWCPVCQGISYLWTEQWVKVYTTLEASTDTSNAFLNKTLPPGILNIPAIIFYCKYDITFYIDDRIMTVELENDGSVVSPTVRTAAYRINFAYDYRADNGKREYWKLFTHLEKLKYLNEPSYSSPGT
jgi:hypothetical protein